MVWSAAYSTFVHSLLSPVATGGFCGLSPLNKAPSPPQIETWNTINQWSFCQFLECQSPRTNAKPPTENFLATVLSLLFIHKKPNLTQMKQELKYLRAQWHE